MAEQSVWSRPAIYTTGDEAPMLFRDLKQDQLSTSGVAVWDVERETWRRVDRKRPRCASRRRPRGRAGPGEGNPAPMLEHRTTSTRQEGRGQATGIPFRPSTTWLLGCSRGAWALSRPRSSPPAQLRARTVVHQQRVLHPLLGPRLEQLVGARGGAAGPMTRRRTGPGCVDKRTVSADSKQHKSGRVREAAGQSVGHYFAAAASVPSRIEPGVSRRRGWLKISDGAR